MWGLPKRGIYPKIRPSPTEGPKLPMKTAMDPKTSLTVAAQQSGVLVRVEYAGGSAATNARRVPYSELYRQRNGLYETPIQRIQRAAEDEAAREAQSD